MAYTFDSVFGARFPRQEHKIWQECPELGQDDIFAAAVETDTTAKAVRVFSRPVHDLVHLVKSGIINPGHYLRMSGNDDIVLTRVGPRGGTRDVWNFGNSSDIKNGLFIAGKLKEYRSIAKMRFHGFRY